MEQPIMTVDALKMPIEPWAPIEPKEYRERRCEVYVSLDEATRKPWTLEDLKKALPKNVSINDLRFAPTDSYDGGTDIWYVEEVKNPLYKSQMKQYKKLKAIYDEELVKYEAQMKDYTAWQEAEELKALEKRLAELKTKQAKQVKEIRELEEAMGKKAAKKS